MHVSHIHSISVANYLTRNKWKYIRGAQVQVRVAQRTSIPCTRAQLQEIQGSAQDLSGTR